MDWPAWIQAVGSVGAIASGFLALGVQNRKQRALELERERRADKRRLLAVREIIRLAEDAGFFAASIAPLKNSAFGSQLQAVARDLREVARSPAWADIPDPSLLPRLSLIVQAANTYDGFAAKALAGNMTDDDWIRLAEFSEAAQQDAIAAAVECQAALDLLETER